MAYKPQAGPQMAAPNVIPMADIMLVLLIIFMVITPMLQKGQSVDLVPVNNPREMQDADKDDAVIVAITRDGRVFLGNTQMNKEDLTGQIKDRISSRLDKTVYVKSDARAKYGDVVAVVDEIRSAGVDQLGLLTQKIQKAQTAPPPPPGTEDRAVPADPGLFGVDRIEVVRAFRLLIHARRAGSHPARSHRPRRLSPPGL